MLQVITTGKDLVSLRKHTFAAGVEGQCVCANPAQDTIAVGCRDSSILVRVPPPAASLAPHSRGLPTVPHTDAAPSARPVCVASPQLLDAANLQVMNTLDLGLKDDGTITSITYRPDTLGATQNVALLTRVR